MCITSINLNPHLPQISIEVRQVRVVQTHARNVIHEPLEGVIFYS